MISEPKELVAWRRLPFVEDKEEPQDRLEVGIISDDPEDASGKLQTFLQQIEAAAKQCLDGRKTRYMTFDWSETVHGTPRLNPQT